METQEFNIKKYTKTSIFMSKILRHDPESVGLKMDKSGWVDTKDLIACLNKSGHSIDFETLELIVKHDEKQRYKFNENKSRIKACQGHSIAWVIPEINYDIEYDKYPEYVYHGTTTEAMQQIYKSGYISKMQRHAVHTHADINMAWKSARRWKGKHPVVLKISVKKLLDAGYKFGVSDNDVWCAESIPVSCIVDKLYS